MDIRPPKYLESWLVDMIDDAVALIAFAVLFSIAKALTGSASLNIMDILVWPLVEIFGSLALGAVLGFGISLGFRFFKSRANRMILFHTFH